LVCAASIRAVTLLIILLQRVTLEMLL
jgi:hypothetical protein